MNELFFAVSESLLFLAEAVKSPLCTLIIVIAAVCIIWKYL